MSVHHVERAMPIDGEATRLVKLSRGSADHPPGGQRVAVGPQYLDTIVDCIRDIHLPRGIRRHICWQIKLTECCSFDPPCSQRLTGGRELHHAIVQGIGDVDVSCSVNADSFRFEETGSPGCTECSQ